MLFADLKGSMELLADCDPEEARRIHLERALTAATHLPQTREVIEQAIDVRLDLRHAIHTLGEVERAMGLMRGAESLAEGLGDKTRMGKIFLSLSTGLWMLDYSDDAQDPGRHALAVAEATGDSLLKYQARDHLPRLHHDRGDYRQAAAMLRESLSSLEAAESSPLALTLVPLSVVSTT